MNSDANTITTAKIVQDVAGASVVPSSNKTMSTAALAVGLSLVCIGLAGIVVLTWYFSNKKHR